MCFCSQHPAADPCLAVTPSSPAHSWSTGAVPKATCPVWWNRAGIQDLGAGVSAEPGGLWGSAPLILQDSEISILMPAQPASSGGGCLHPQKPPHTRSHRPWLLLPGVRCNKGDEFPPYGQHTLCGLPLALGSQNFFLSLSNVRLNKTK